MCRISSDATHHEFPRAPTPFGIPPRPTHHPSRVVTRKLSVLSIIPAAPKLPTAETRGATGLAAIKAPRVICLIVYQAVRRSLPPSLGPPSGHEAGRSTRGLATSRYPASA
jgi:hypothetical protein